jgi:hypothetical protein
MRGTGRDFAAWLGLVPKQISTGDRTPGSRTMRAKARDEWRQGPRLRRPQPLAGPRNGHKARTKELVDEALTTEEPAEVCETKRRDGDRSSRRLRTLVTLMALFAACPLIRSHAR